MESLQPNWTQSAHKAKELLNSLLQVCRFPLPHQDVPIPWWHAGIERYMGFPYSMVSGPWSITFAYYHALQLVGHQSISRQPFNAAPLLRRHVSFADAPKWFTMK